MINNNKWPISRAPPSPTPHKMAKICHVHAFLLRLRLMIFLAKSFKVLIASLEANRGSIKKQLKENEIINKNI